MEIQWCRQLRIVWWKEGTASPIAASHPIKGKVGEQGEALSRTWVVCQRKYVLKGKPKADCVKAGPVLAHEEEQWHGRALE